MLPNDQHEKQVRGREAVVEDYHLPPLKKIGAKMEKGKLCIDGKEFISEIKCPKTEDLMNLPRAKVDALKKMYDECIKEGALILLEDSKFQGYTAEISTIDEVNQLYMAMKYVHRSARHVTCSFRLPGKNFLKFQDCCDDGEWGAARHVLNAMKSCDIEFRVIFVTRRYTGKHVGVARFEAYLRAARSAVAHFPPHRIPQSCAPNMVRGIL